MASVAEQLATQYIDGYNTRDEAAIRSLFASPVQWDGQEILLDDIDFAVWWEALPDLHLSLDRIIADDTQAAFRFTMTGTHEAPFYGIDPSGASIEVTEMIMISVEDGRISSLHFEWDELGFYAQLGAVDHPLS